MNFCCTKAVVEKNSLATEVAATWGKALQLKYGPFALFFFCSTLYRCFRTKLRNPNRLRSLMRASKRVRNALHQLKSFDSTKTKDLEDFILSTFSWGKRF